MIRFSHVTKKYRGAQRPALNGVDFEINRGEFVFLVGASGSGKSSCLRLMIKEDKPNSGAIHVLGQDLGSISNRKVPYFRRNLGVVFQDFRLLPNKTVFDNVAFTLQVIGKSRGFIQEAVPDVLKMVGLAGKAQRYPHELSGGEQQRVAIARAIVNKPALLLADEPTGNLDPATSAGIMALLERINAGGTTIVMATHAADFVDRMQKRVIELVAGQIVRDEREAGYGQTAALPIVGQATIHNSTGDLTAAAAAAMAAPSRAQAIVTQAQQPQIIETTDIVVPSPVFAEVDEITMDAVPDLPSAYDTSDIDELGEFRELFGMNDSQVVARLNETRQDSPPVTRPPFTSADQSSTVPAPSPSQVPTQVPPASEQLGAQPAPAVQSIDINDPAFATLPLTERLRLQAQARAKQGDSDQNVGPVK
jgi:cell division transport system ATP-binding protein